MPETCMRSDLGTWKVCKQSMASKSRGKDPQGSEGCRTGVTRGRFIWVCLPDKTRVGWPDRRHGVLVGCLCPRACELARSVSRTAGGGGQAGPRGQANREGCCAKGQGARQRTAMGKSVGEVRTGVVRRLKHQLEEPLLERLGWKPFKIGPNPETSLADRVPLFWVPLSPYDPVPSSRGISYWVSTHLRSIIPLGLRWVWASKPCR